MTPEANSRRIGLIVGLFFLSAICFCSGMVALTYTLVLQRDDPSHTVGAIYIHQEDIAKMAKMNLGDVIVRYAPSPTEMGYGIVRQRTGLWIYPVYDYPAAGTHK